MAGPGKRGPKRKFDGPQIERIYAHMREGHGRYRACQLEGASYETLRKRFKEDPAILEQIIAIERARTEDCFEGAYSLRKHEDPVVRLKAINVYLSQTLKVQEARRAVADRKEALKGTRADSKELVGLTDRIAKVIIEFVPEERQDQALMKLEALDKEIQAMVG